MAQSSSAAAIILLLAFSVTLGEAGRALLEPYADGPYANGYSGRVLLGKPADGPYADGPYVDGYSGRALFEEPADGPFPDGWLVFDGLPKSADGPYNLDVEPIPEALAPQPEAALADNGVKAAAKSHGLLP